jgi:hypothetical protein
MTHDQNTVSGLEALIAHLDARYATDERGRLSDSRTEGILPRFVLGRSAEGCVWRFRVDLDSASVTAIARLAAREPGASYSDEDSALPPERLVMMERLLATEGVPVSSRREILERGGRAVAELWTID